MKNSRGITVKNFRKCLKTLLNGCFSNQHSKEFLSNFLLKSGITKGIVCGDASLSRVSVMLVLKFCREQ